MAEAIARHLVATDAIEGSEGERWAFRSAGLWAGSGSAATLEAVNAMERAGADLTSHQSQPVTIPLLEWATAIYGMTSSHVEGVRQMLPPEHRHRVELLDPGRVDVHDPIGMPQETYDQTAQQLRAMIEARLKELAAL